MICAWCGETFDQRNVRGPKPKFCRAACRQRAFEDRQPERYATALVASGLLKEGDMEAAARILREHRG